MASFLSHLNPINAFPEYHGPYHVGTVDVEIPTADLPQPCEVPEDAPPTVAFRIFYPCIKPSSSESDRPVRWIPQPQRLSVAALIKFLGITEKKASALSYLTQWFYYININGHRNAPIHKAPTSNGRWPVTFFSHGLAGSRNAYSYICGNIASNGMVVLAIDHRDGSSPVQYVRATENREAYSVPAVKISHEACDQVWEARDKQLRIRLCEMNLVYEAISKIDIGEKLNNLDENTSHRHRDRIEVLQRFRGTLDVHRPGKVSWAGHSFGACTVAQWVKSIFYSPDRPDDSGKPLIKPTAEASILQQITPESPVIMLDMWGLPFQSPQQKYLWERPMPSYATGGPNGGNLISILSEGFANWTSNANTNKYIVAAPSSSRSQRPSRAPKILPQWARLRDESPSRDSGYGSEYSTARDHSTSSSSSEPPSQQGPHMFYTAKSQHFSQSDFGILFPYLARRLAKAEEPERILELNTRAIVQMLRESGVEVAGEDDKAILEREGEIRRWKVIAVNEGVGEKVEMERGEDARPTDDVAFARTKGEGAVEM